jgi:hypothetical protein
MVNAYLNTRKQYFWPMKCYELRVVQKPLQQLTPKAVPYAHLQRVDLEYPCNFLLVKMYFLLQI